MLPRVTLLVVTKQIRQSAAQFLSASVVLNLSDYLFLLNFFRLSLASQGKSGWHRLHRHHLYEDLLGVLEPLVKRLIRDLQINIVLRTQRHRLHFLL